MAENLARQMAEKCGQVLVFADIFAAASTISPLPTDDNRPATAVLIGWLQTLQDSARANTSDKPSNNVKGAEP